MEQTLASCDLPLATTKSLFINGTMPQSQHRPSPRPEPQIADVKMTQNNSDNPSVDPVLDSYRRSIDNIDAALIHMLAERFRITQAVGEYKARTQLAPADPNREERQIKRLRSLAEDADLDPEFSEKFIRFVIDEVIRHHNIAREK